MTDVSNPATPPGTLPDWDSAVDDEERYGGASGALKAFGLGAARSASFGLSDEFLTKSGAIKPEDLRAYKETNPNATGAGEIGGVLGAILAPESGIAGVLSAPVKAVSRVGGAITEAAVPLAETVAGKIAGKAIAAGAGSAVEGAAYGLGQSVSEHALGDPDLNGEMVISNVMNSALFGGALGGVLKGAEAVVPAGLEAARSAVGSLAERLAGTLPENSAARISSALSGKGAEDIAPLLAKPFTEEGAAMRKNALEGYAERETTARELTDHLKESSDSLESAVHDYYQGPRSEEVSKLMGGVPYERAFNAATDLTGQLKSAIKEMRAEPEIYSSTGRIRQLELVSDALEKKVSDSSTAEDIYHAINDAKGQIDPLAKFGKIPNEAETATVQKMKEVRYQLRAHLENPAVYGEGGARQAALNEAYSEYAKASKDLLSTFGKKVPSTGKRSVDAGKVMTYLNQVGRPAGDTGHEILQNYIEASQRLVGQMANTQKNAISKIDTKKLMNLFEKTQGHAAGAESELEAVNRYKRLKDFGDQGILGSAIGVGAASHVVGAPVAAAEALYGVYHTLRHPAELVRVLSKVERAVIKTNAAIDKGVKAVFDIGDFTRPARSYAVAASRSKADQHKEHDERLAGISELNATPEKLIDRVHESTAGIGPYAPQTAQGAQGAMTRAAQFLRAKMPEKPDSGPFGGKYQPSDAELKKWRRYFSVINDPIQTLDHIRSGTLTADSVEALSAVYPKLYAEMKSKLFDQITEHVAKKREPIPYNRRLTLSLFMGQDLTPSLKSQNILATQNTLATATARKKAEEAADRARVNSKGMASLSKSKMMLTPGQASAARSSA